MVHANPATTAMKVAVPLRITLPVSILTVIESPRTFPWDQSVHRPTNTWTDAMIFDSTLLGVKEQEHNIRLPMAQHPTQEIQGVCKAEKRRPGWAKWLTKEFVIGQ
jgi:hypothetical protein